MAFLPRRVENTSPWVWTPSWHLSLSPQSCFPFPTLQNPFATVHLFLKEWVPPPIQTGAWPRPPIHPSSLIISPLSYVSCATCPNLNPSPQPWNTFRSFPSTQPSSGRKKKKKHLWLSLCPYHTFPLSLSLPFPFSSRLPQVSPSLASHSIYCLSLPFRWLGDSNSLIQSTLLFVLFQGQTWFF